MKLGMIRVPILLISCLVPAAGQLTTGTLSGSLRDEQSAAIAGATVSLLDEARGTRLPAVTSSVNGDLVIPNIPTGSYPHEVRMKGFKTLKRTGIAVSAGDQTGLGVLTLEVGAVAESITVSAEAAQLQTQSAERSFTITPSSVQNLPIGDRASTGGSNNNIMTSLLEAHGNRGETFRQSPRRFHVRRGTPCRN